MSAYVDGLLSYPLAAYHGDVQAKRVGARHGHEWCHLYADTKEELHLFAAGLGMKRVWAQMSRRGIPHYDLTPTKRAAAVQKGAVELDRHAARILRARLRVAVI